VNAPVYTADDIATAFGDTYSGKPAGLMIPLNALDSCARELDVLALAGAAEDGHVDFEMVLLCLSRRMKLAAEVGHKEIRALLAHVAELEGKLAEKAEAAE